MYLPNISFLPLKEQAEFQLRALHQTLHYIQKHSPFYKKHLKDFLSTEIFSLNDLEHFPTTNKEMMHAFNADFACVSPNSIVEYTATSGTLGRPVTISLTENDLRRLAYNEEQSFRTAGFNSRDIVQLLLTLDKQFMAGMAYYSGLRNLGAGIIRTGPGVPAMQWEVAQSIHSTAWVAVPSFVVKLLSYAKAHSIPLESIPVKKIMCIGEPVRNEQMQLNVLGKTITEQWGVTLYSTYASTEMQTAFTECSAGQGGHLQPDLLILEILDEEGNALAPGEVGEVTITTLGIESMPLFRYRTGDLAAFYNEPCACGRNSIRLGPIVGRKQQMIKLKGTTLYPPVVFDVLNEVNEVENYIVEISKDEWGNDRLRVLIYTSVEQSVCKKILSGKMLARLRVQPEIVFISQPEMIKIQQPDGLRKPIKWMDLR